MQIGRYTVHSIETGEFALDGGAMFGIVPKPLWEKRIGVDARNRIDMRMRCLLIQGEVNDTQRNILVDTGIGNKWSDKERDIYRIDERNFTLENSLAAHGLTRNDITDVILTHLHFDHVGGATKLENDKLIPSFPHATYYVQQAQLDWAQQPTGKDAGSFIAADIEPLLEAKQLKTINGPHELFPDIHLRLSQGHTTAMQHPVIHGDDTTAFYCADLLPTSLHVRIPWIMAYDVRPLVTLEEKQSLLSEACRENWLLIFEHCPLHDASYLQQTDKGIQLGNTIALS